MPSQRTTVGLLAMLMASQIPAPASGQPAVEHYARVSLRELVRDPARWNGRRVEVMGFAVSDFENHGIYETEDEMCGDEHPRIAIYANWQGVSGVRRGGRMGRFRGIFQNNNPRFERDEAGEEVIIISNAAPGPGPLSQITVVHWRGPLIYPLRCAR